MIIFLRYILSYWGLGIGDLGFGVWGLGARPPPPNPPTNHPQPTTPQKKKKKKKIKNI